MLQKDFSLTWTLFIFLLQVIITPPPHTHILLTSLWLYWHARCSGVSSSLVLTSMEVPWAISSSTILWWPCEKQGNNHTASSGQQRSIATVPVGPPCARLSGRRCHRSQPSAHCWPQGSRKEWGGRSATVVCTSCYPGNVLSDDSTTIKLIQVARLLHSPQLVQARFAHFSYPLVYALVGGSCQPVSGKLMSEVDISSRVFSCNRLDVRSSRMT